MAASKKLLLKIAHILLNHWISKYIKIQIKSSDGRFLVKMTWKHFSKSGNSWLSICARWLFSPSQNCSSSLLADWHPELCSHGPQSLSAAVPLGAWPQFLVPVPPASPGFLSCTLLPPHTFTIQLIHVLDLCFCSIQVIQSFLNLDNWVLTVRSECWSRVWCPQF